MSKSRIIEDGTAYFADGRYKARIRVYQIPVCAKFPDGFKVSCVLVDMNTMTARLVLDNHQPFGYHIHTDMPLNKNVRLEIEVRNYKEAIQIFFTEAIKVTNEEK